MQEIRPAMGGGVSPGMGANTGLGPVPGRSQYKGQDSDSVGHHSPSIKRQDYQTSVLKKIMQIHRAINGLLRLKIGN